MPNPSAGGYASILTDAAPSVVTAFDLTMIDRLLMFVRRDPVFRDLVQTFSSRVEANLVTLEAMRAAFDLDTAVGDQLDAIGSILQRPRLPGYSDARYRTILRIQVLLILASQGTTATVLEVIERFTGVPATHYAENYPMGFEVGAAVAPADTALLLQLLNEARSAAYNGTLVASETDSGSGDPSTDPGSLVMEYLPYPEDPDGPVSTQALAVREFVEDQFLQWDNPADLSATPFSCAIWVRHDDLGTFHRIFRANPIGAGAAMLVDIDSLGRVVVNRDYSGTDRIRRTSDTLAADRWYYVAWTLDNADAATGIRLYIDGVEAAYGFAQNGVGSPTDFGGAWFLSANAGSFDGRIADARVWTAELTPDEIWLEYLSTGAPVRTADLVFNPDLATLNDPISGLDGTADGTTLLLDEPVPDIAVLDDEPGDPLPGAALMPHAQHF